MGWLHERVADGAYRGALVFIVGGDRAWLDAQPPELWGAFERAHVAERALVLATNARGLLLPRCWAVSADRHYVDRHGPTHTNPTRIAGVHPATLWKPAEWEWCAMRGRRSDPWGAPLADGPIYGGNTGCFALGLADALCDGVGLIALLGYRLGSDEPQRVADYDRWRGTLECRRREVRTPVAVCSPSTLSDAWPRVELTELLAEVAV